MAPSLPPRSTSTIRLRAIARELKDADFPDEPPTSPALQALDPKAPETRAAGSLIAVLQAFPTWARLPALVFLLASLLAGFYLWRTL